MRQARVVAGAALAGLLAWLGVACAPARVVWRPVRYVDYKAPFAADAKLLSRHCPCGQPKLDPLWSHGQTVLVCREGYVLEHSSRDKIPLWVCERIPKEQLLGDVKRPSPDDKYFQPDPQLEGHPRSERRDYRGSGYDRGHQAPAGDQTTSLQRKIETYYLSNIAPQVGIGFNRHIWAKLEEQARTWIEARGEGYVITGALFYDEEETADSGDGWMQHKVIGKGRVAVPTHFYKIILVQTSDGKWDAIAFVLENKKHPKKFKLESAIRSIDWIEAHTGIDVLPELDLVEQRQLEAKVAAMWN